MTIPISLAGFSMPDSLALGLLLCLSTLIGWVIEHPPKSRMSVTVLMTEYRRDWMRQFVTRQPRIFDANIIDGLRRGTAFFASACMITLGGGIAIIGNAERLNSVAADLTMPPMGAELEIKLIVVLLFVASALLKFIWAHRLFGYCAIMMAAIPNEVNDPSAYPRAARCAEINITAARSFNRALRAIYFALGALGWLLGPEVLIATTLLTVAVLVRREFASASRLSIMQHTPV